MAAWFGAGCAIGRSVEPSAAAAPWSGWAAREGGITQGQQPEALTRACAVVSVPPQRVRVLACGRPCAFAWPDGSLFVTRGLLELLNEEELAAVLAHEMGHLLADGAAADHADHASPGQVRALAGRDEVEERADAGACRILCRAGMSPGALARALVKVRDAPGTPPACREALNRRILVLDAR